MGDGYQLTGGLGGLGYQFAGLQQQMMGQWVTSGYTSNTTGTSTSIIVEPNYYEQKARPKKQKPPKSPNMQWLDERVDEMCVKL